MSAARWLVVLALALVTGCARNAPQYQSSLENIDAAGRLPRAVAVGKFEFERGKEAELNKLSARADSFSSPVNDSYADYIAGAVAAELKAAGKLDANAPLRLTGIVQKNELSAGGINTNDAEVAVRFNLQDASGTRYDKTIAEKHEWESSFMGGIAIPRAIQNYVVTVQRMLRKLYTDPEFARAMAK